MIYQVETKGDHDGVWIADSSYIDFDDFISSLSP